MPQCPPNLSLCRSCNVLPVHLARAAQLQAIQRLHPPRRHTPLIGSCLVLLRRRTAAPITNSLSCPLDVVCYESSQASGTQPDGTCTQPTVATDDGIGTDGFPTAILQGKVVLSCSNGPNSHKICHNLFRKLYCEVVLVSIAYYSSPDIEAGLSIITILLKILKLSSSVFKHFVRDFLLLLSRCWLHKPCVGPRNHRYAYTEYNETSYIIKIIFELPRSHNVL